MNRHKATDYVAPNGKERHVPEKLRDAFDYLITMLDGLCDFGDTIMSKRDKCFDCKRRWSGNAAPMVQDEVWAATGMDGQALLCEICLRKRLDRDFCVADSESARSTISGLYWPRFIKRSFLTTRNIIRLLRPLNRFLIRLMLFPAIRSTSWILIIAKTR